MGLQKSGSSKIYEIRRSTTQRNLFTEFEDLRARENKSKSSCRFYQSIGTRRGALFYEL